MVLMLCSVCPVALTIPGEQSSTQTKEDSAVCDKGYSKLNIMELNITSTPMNMHCTKYCYDNNIALYYISLSQHYIEQ